MSKRHFFFTFLSLILFYQGITAQSYKIQKIPVENNTGSAVLRKLLYVDSDGFIWYSTYNGVVREMGVDRVLYPLDAGENKNILFISNFHETKEGLFWFLTKYGAVQLNPNTKEVLWIKIEGEIIDDVSTELTNITQDNDGNIWFSNNNTLFRFSQDGKTVEYSLNALEETKNIGYIKFLIHKKGSLFFGTSQSEYIFKFIPQKQSFSVEKSSAFVKTLDDKVLFENKTSNLFSSKKNGRYWFENESYAFKYLESLDQYVFHIPSYNLKVGPNGKVYSYEANAIQVFEMVKGGGQLELKQVKTITLAAEIMDISLDKENNVIAITQDGLFYIQRSFFTSYLNSFKTPPVSARSFGTDQKGNLYVYTQSGFFIKRKNEATFKPITFFKEGTNKPLPIAFYGFLQQDHNTLWLYGFSESLYKINLHKGTFTSYYPPKPFPSNIYTHIKDLELIDEKHILYGSNEGLYLFNTKTNIFLNKSQLNDSINIEKANIHDILLSKNKSTLWIATEEGLYKKNRKSGQVIHYSEESTTHKIISNKVTIIHEDINGYIWIGTQAGLQKISPSSELPQILSVKDGLKNDHIVGILEVGSDLWLGTYNGLVQYNTSTKSIEVFHSESGLPSDEFNAKSFYKEDNNSLYFGGINGIVNFNPTENSSNKDNPKLVMVEAKRFDDTLNTYKTLSFPLDENVQFDLPYNKNYIKFSFAINDILGGEKNIYQYRINPLRDDWISLESFNKLELLGLESNDYSIEVRGFDSNGNPTNILTYNVKVEQDFYRSNMFRLLLALILILGIVTLSLYRRHTLKESFRQKNKLVALEAKALRTQMNPHFIFNAMSGIQSTMIIKGEKEANKYVNSFSKLLRATLDMTNSEFITIENEISYLKSYIHLEEMRSNKQFTTSFSVSKNIDIKEEKVPCMMLQPIVENSILHGFPTKKENCLLSISFQKEEDLLILEVTDNGIGRKLSEKNKQRLGKDYKSWAIQILEERVKNANFLKKDTISVEIIDLIEENLPLGTQVIIKFRSKQRALKNNS
jgi:ligand-binding sensor domain-containing protein